MYLAINHRKLIGFKEKTKKSKNQDYGEYFPYFIFRRRGFVIFLMQQNISNFSRIQILMTPIGAIRKNTKICLLVILKSQPTLIRIKKNKDKTKNLDPEE